MKNDQASTCELSIVMPCLNEAETVATCIDKARGFLAAHGVGGEVVVADNGSTDGSQEIARLHGARVVHVPTPGYGAASMGGIEAAQGKYIIMGDADDSYDFTALEPFLEKLREGYELVMGNRFKGKVNPDAMPPLHRYLGNPVLSGIGHLFFKSPVGDFHCGLRGFNKESIQSLNLRTTGMEFASEMVAKAAIYKLKVIEVPTTLFPDGRSRRPHLRSWHDGWRHLRFMLIYCPRWLFLYPGMYLSGFGLVAMLWLLPEPRKVFDVTFDIHTMLYAAIAIVLGIQAISLALFYKVFAVGIGLIPEDEFGAMVLKKYTLERGLVIGGVLMVIGIAGSFYALISWGEASFGPVSPVSMMRITIPSLTALTVGVQVVFASFFLGVLGLNQNKAC